jgi:hypothetical protein
LLDRVHIVEQGCILLDRVHIRQEYILLDRVHILLDRVHIVRQSAYWWARPHIVRAGKCILLNRSVVDILYYLNRGWYII